MTASRVRFVGDPAVSAEPQSWCDRCGSYCDVDELERVDVPAPSTVLAKDGVLRLLLCAGCRGRLRKGDG